MLLYMPVEAADVVKCYSWDRAIIPDYLLGSIQAQESFIFSVEVKREEKESQRLKIKKKVEYWYCKITIRRMWATCRIKGLDAGIGREVDPFMHRI